MVSLGLSTLQIGRGLGCAGPFSLRGLGVPRAPAASEAGRRSQVGGCPWCLRVSPKSWTHVLLRISTLFGPWVLTGVWAGGGVVLLAPLASLRHRWGDGPRKDLAALGRLPGQLSPPCLGPVELEITSSTDGNLSQSRYAGLDGGQPADEQQLRTKGSGAGGCPCPVRRELVLGRGENELFTVI